MMQRTLDVSYDELIIGSDIGALHHCLNKQIPMVFLRCLRPNIYNISLEHKKLDLYNNLLFDICFNKNLCHYSNFVNNARLEDENLIKLNTKNNVTINVKFNTLHLYDDYKIEGLSSDYFKTNNLNLINDYFRLVGNSEQNNTIITNDFFVKSIHFHTYKNITTAQPIAVSIIEDENLDKFEWSQTASKIKLFNILVENGYKGRWDKTNNYYKSISLTSRHREVFPMSKKIYNNIPKSIKQYEI